MNRDDRLIFENYLNYNKNIISEADEKKWEDESSAWAWFKVFDPTGLSSWPDVYDSAVEVRDNRGKDIWPWLKLIFNVFLALPNFGILAFGAGAGGWAALRAASKAALKSGAKGGGGEVAQKIVKTIGESDIMRAAFSKIVKRLETEGILSPGQIGTIINQIRTKGVSAAGREEMVAKAVKSSITDAAKDSALKKIQLPKTAGRAGVQLTGAASEWIKGGSDAEDVFSFKGDDKEKSSSKSEDDFSELDDFEGLSMPEPKPKTKQTRKELDIYDLPDL
jgi:hypothetical protein